MREYISIKKNMLLQAITYISKFTKKAFLISVNFVQQRLDVIF